MKLFLPLLLFYSLTLFAGELSVTVPFSGADLNIAREGFYTSVSIPGMPSMFSPGTPALPIMPVRVALPTGCSN